LSRITQTTESIEPSALAEAIAAIRDAELVVYPTETFYGLAADPYSDVALNRLFAVKGREAAKAVALIAADTASAFAIAREVPKAALILAEAFWPGPLTLVLPARDGFRPSLLGPDGGIGVRVSPHPIACALAAGLGHPVTATSANLSGDPPAVTVEQARIALGERVRVYLEGGTLAGGAPSTLIAFEAAGVRIVRAGAIGEDAINSALNGVRR
jgi:L-threonylcarbamoyladenylate synthase